MVAELWTPQDGPDDVPPFDDIPEAFQENGAAPVLKIAPTERAPWLLDAADLLAEPDPGPTPWLVEDLIVDQAIIAAVGRWKTTKSYGLLDLCISIATGEPAFGVLEIPEPGPVIFVNEESGRAALWRRLDALCRGRGINPDRLRGRLLVAANARIRLDDEAWQDELLNLAHLKPRLYVFDPLARMKDPAREENEQSAMAVLLEFIRTLREHAKAAVCFVHHTGHAGDHMRGSSDLETVWETRLRWKREGQSPVVTIESEHREAEAAEPIEYRIAWDTPTRSMRFNLVMTDQDGMPPLAARATEWLRINTGQTTKQVAQGLNVRESDVRRTLEELEKAGISHRGRSGRTDQLGRPIRDKVWNLTETHPITLDVANPKLGIDQDQPPSDMRGPVGAPDSKEGSPREQPPEQPQNASSHTDDDIPF